ncbi:MAG: hypothetical protein IJ794_15385, partial [Lachnospiraceae bacterium]|nr:hypothetical protein [Lachnospiraceae bacterium]MBR1854498.1 hypothetical protein [Lachnospiraceae bacterium]
NTGYPDQAEWNLTWDKNGCKLNGEKSLGQICAGILCDSPTDSKFTLSVRWLYLTENTEGSSIEMTDK